MPSLRSGLTEEQIDAAFPRTRAECEDGPRPCPWVRCRYHLLGEALFGGRGYKIYLHRDGVQGPWDLDPEWSCALDVADRGPLTLERIGQVMGVTRERVRQIESRVMRRAAGVAPYPSERSLEASREFRRLWRMLRERAGLPAVECQGTNVPRTAGAEEA